VISSEVCRNSIIFVYLGNQRRLLSVKLEIKHLSV